MLLMVFHAILRQILNHCFCAISLRELSVCAILRFFQNLSGHLNLNVIFLNLICFLQLFGFCTPSSRNRTFFVYPFLRGQSGRN